MNDFKRIAVLTSGGDAPGMNAAVRSVVRTALGRGVEVMGVFGGYRGLIHEEMKLLSTRDVSHIINLGGTMLYSDRCLEFKTEEGLTKAAEVCRKNGIGGLVTIGGDGTFRGAADIVKYGVPAIGIPGTIDNDITATDYSIGFDTAMNTVIQMVDRLRDTCESHARCNVVEVMGRGCGQIALLAGIAVGAVAIAIPEIEFDTEAAIKKIIKAKKSGRRHFIVVVSEGLGGKFGEELTEKINSETGIETKFARLAHVVRGGSPSLRDRVAAAQMGEEAIAQILAGKSNLVICEDTGKILVTEINYALKLDAMYKDKLQENDLKEFSVAQIKEMRAICEKKRSYIVEMYKLADEISK